MTAADELELVLRALRFALFAGRAKRERDASWLHDWTDSALLDEIQEHASWRPELSRAMEHAATLHRGRN